MITNITEKLVADTIAAEIYLSSVIVVEANNTVSVGLESAEVIVSGGAQGPQGLPAEEDMAYAKRTDFVGTDVIYRAEAIVGSTNASASWRIRKITFVGIEGDIVEEWAGGTALFDKIWDNRLSLSYS